MPVKQVFTGKVPVKVYTDDLDDMAKRQLQNMAHLPFVHHHIAAMPDAHAGMGATIGSVIPTKGAIIPAAVGVDLGCGMMAVKLNLTANDLPDSLGRVRFAIEAAIPHGRTDNGGTNDKGAWHETPEYVLRFWKESGIEATIPGVLDRHPKLMRGRVNTHRHLGTLGTGNHFIEVCLDENDAVWAMLHSGSRGIGNRLGSYFIQLAKEEMKRWFINLPDKNLAYLVEGSEHFEDYLAAVNWAQDFALANREIMMRHTLAAIKNSLGRDIVLQETAINCHHNYVALEHHYRANVWVTRKGAIRARKDDPGIIPGSMGAKSFIVRGLGNPEGLCSCAHGAGRSMSRTQAKKIFSVSDLAQQTDGVECRKDAGVIDEIPSAYKDIDTVMENQNDLVEVIHILKQVINVKG